VKNVTVSLDDDTYRRARMIAAERDTSISALVKDFLVRLGSGESQVERLKREERALRESITSFRASDKQSRDELHERAPHLSTLQFLDTNILLYSICRDPNETRKREQAIALMDEDAGALSVQVLQEFYVQATRVSRPDAIPERIGDGSFIRQGRRSAVTHCPNLAGPPMPLPDPCPGSG
jgi:uncharacterized protein YdaU (DUF1376 family)